MGLLLANLDTVEKLVGLVATVLTLLGFNEYARRTEAWERASALAIHALRAACLGAIYGLMFALTFARNVFWANAMVSVALVVMLMSVLAWLIAALFEVENGGFWTGALGGAALWLIFKFIERAPLSNGIELGGFVVLGALTGLLLQWVETPPQFKALKSLALTLRRWLRPKSRSRGRK